MLHRVTLTATGTFDLGTAGDDTVNTWALQVTGTWTGSLLTKGYLAGRVTQTNNNTRTALTAADATDLAYKDESTGTFTDPGATAITANGAYLVAVDGKALVLDWTRTSGTIVIHARPFRG